MKHILFLSLLFISALRLPAQKTKPVEAADKYDVVLMVNGEEKNGKVTDIGDDAVKFVHRDESIQYTIKKSDIFKITFSSGRVEFFTVSNLSSAPAKDSSAADHHNKVAVLPFGYIADQRDGSEEMKLKVQNECYNVLSKNARLFQIQDPQTTNALLIKAGVDDNNVRGYTMGEICDILKVEYVLQGVITVNRGSTTSSTNSYSNIYGTSKEQKNTVVGDVFRFRGGSSSSSYTVNQQNFQTNVLMNIYTDKGQKVFGQDHNSFWSSVDSYKITLGYLLKRTPVYKK